MSLAFGDSRNLHGVSANKDSMSFVMYHVLSGWTQKQSPVAHPSPNDPSCRIGDRTRVEHCDPRPWARCSLRDAQSRVLDAALYGNPACHVPECTCRTRGAGKGLCGRCQIDCWLL